MSYPTSPYHNETVLHFKAPDRSEAAEAVLSDSARTEES